MISRSGICVGLPLTAPPAVPPAILATLDELETAVTLCAAASAQLGFLQAAPDDTPDWDERWAKASKEYQEAMKRQVAARREHLAAIVREVRA